MKSSLYENVHPEAAKILNEASIKVKEFKSALGSTDADVDIIGIRSASRLSASDLSDYKNLKAIGTFCIGTDMVDLSAAAKLGIPVFNSPHSSTRSVAELVIGQIINLSRRTLDNSIALRENKWEKSAAGRYEIRGKTLGIIGYGNIGSTVGILAEALGMQVIFYDIVKKLSYGTAKRMSSLNSCLTSADFITLHVPLTPMTSNLIGEKEITQMKRGSYLLNTSRGNVVNIGAVIDALDSKHLAGFYADVFPYEPSSNGKWCTLSSDMSLRIQHQLIQLSKMSNVILTSHIGGATEEAQKAIAEDVATKLVLFINTGSTLGAVNVPQLSLQEHIGISSLPNIDIESLPKVPSGCAKVPLTTVVCRIINFHHNVPGVLRDLNSCIENYNIIQQTLGTLGNIGYCIMDIESVGGDSEILIEKINEKITKLPNTINNRIVLLSN